MPGYWRLATAERGADLIRPMHGLSAGCAVIIGRGTNRRTAPAEPGIDVLHCADGHIGTGAYDRIGITREPDAADPRKNGPSVLSGRLPA